jgi:DNA-directed RNA polymerase specialized sigma54-like protein
MPKMNQINSQKQKVTQKKVLSAGHNQLQQLIISQTHILEQMVQQELDQNPALEIATEPMDDEDKPIDDVDSEDWNQDYDKPYDEYETGESIDVSENFDRVEYDIAANLERVAYEKVKR